MVFRVWTHKTPPSASQAASEAGVAEAMGRQPLWVPPGHLRSCSCCPAPHGGPQSQRRWTLAHLELPSQAMCVSACFTFCVLPGVASPPSGGVQGSRRHYCSLWCEAHPPSQELLYSYLFTLPRGSVPPPSEHTLKLTCKVSARTQDCQVQ